VKEIILKKRKEGKKDYFLGEGRNEGNLLSNR